MMSTETALAVTQPAPPGELERYQTQLRIAEAVRTFVLAKHPNGKYKHLTQIGKGLHCNIEVWRAIAATANYALGVTEVRQCGDGWEADGVVRRVSDGTIVGSGSGYCDALEKFGQGKATYAIRGMAQTRAQSRAAAGVFGQLVVFIHEDLRATPAEEMTDLQEPLVEHARLPQSRVALRTEARPPRSTERVEHLPAAKLPKSIGQRAQLDHDAVTGEVIEPSKVVDEEALLAAYRQAPNALAKAKVLQHVPSDVAERVRRGAHRA
jgi:hypothetical protein